jgi:hypothetical protein
MTREQARTACSGHHDVELGLLALLWEEAPFPRLPRDAPPELKDFVQTVDNPRRVYTIHKASRRHNFQTLVEKCVPRHNPKTLLRLCPLTPVTSRSSLLTCSWLGLSSNYDMDAATLPVRRRRVSPFENGRPAEPPSVDTAQPAPGL